MIKLFILTFFYTIFAYANNLDELLKPNDNIFTPDNTGITSTPSLNINPNASKKTEPTAPVTQAAPEQPTPTLPATEDKAQETTPPNTDEVPNLLDTEPTENITPIENVNNTAPAETKPNSKFLPNILPKLDFFTKDSKPKEEIPPVTQIPTPDNNIQNDTNPPLIESKLDTNNVEKQNPPFPSDTKYIPSTWSGSLMFNEDLVRILTETLEKYKRSAELLSKKGDGSVDNIFDIAGKPNSSPSFYLNSVIYKNENDWVIWINGEKISNKNFHNLSHAFPGLTISFINEEEVGFNYNSNFLKDLSPNWEKKLIKIDNNSYNSATQDIIVNKNSGDIAFNLQPNQTFVLYSMSIEEGYVGDVVIPSPK